jgi:ABC-type proline/glycine betaine transport system ATPase subunit
VLHAVQLEEKRRAWVGKLSGGQRQRLAVACALVCEPDLLFLDEPTTGLDPQSRRQLWDIITGFRAGGGTILLTTHYMEEAERLCDRVAVMDHGRIIALGPPAELIATLGAEQVVEFALGNGASVPIVNLEWIQKIHRDTAERGYAPEDVTETILRRMPDYMRYITPQFSLTDINFQRVPTVDTSNPFFARDIPTSDESFVVIRFTDPVKFNIDFPYLLAMLHDSFMSRRNSIVMPGGKLGLAMEIIFEPIIKKMMEERQALL